MSRVRSSTSTRRKHKKFLRMAKGYRGARSRSYRPARETVQRAMVYSYRDRKRRKREFRRLWIIRISARVRQGNMSYSEFIDGLNKANVTINRKILAEMAVSGDGAFEKLLQTARENRSAS